MKISQAKEIPAQQKLFFQLMMLTCFLLGSFGLQAQQPTQTIRGTINDIDTKTPLIGASIILPGTSPLQGVTTDIDGNFKLEQIPVGRKNIEISYLGYEPVLISSILLTSGKELVLNVEMTESTIAMETVVVTAEYDKAEALNEMASVSARSFSVEETSRYAGSFYDPARMAKNFAGVTLGGTDDLMNEIVVRGNSPRGVLWRLEGIEIPNPNHFSALGGTGGGISMLSSSTLSQSDFYTGAFPAEFGNATSGVFDLNLRRGNNEKREYAFMLGALGMEAALEGPFSQSSKGSYLINYRYSTLGVLKAVGLNPVGDVLPEYQDISFKFHIPTEKAGVFSLFGLGGKNVASFEPAADSTTWNNDDFGEYGFTETQNIGTIGLSHRILLSDRSYLKTVAMASADNYKEDYYYLDAENNYKKVIDEQGNLVNNTFRLSSTFNHKFNARHTFRTGFVLSQMNFDFDYEYYHDDDEVFYTLFDSEGKARLYQGFAAWKFRMNDVVTFNSGLHYTLFGLNNHQSLEPRGAIKWQFAPNQSISASVGLHSKPEHISFYFVENRIEGEGRNSPNKDLDFMKSLHSVLGYDIRFNKNLRMKAEAYYQRLYDIPVENDFNSYSSIINASDTWDIAGALGGVNEGKGYNYGLDLTLEKFFSQQYYFLFTGSVFDSKYVPLNGKAYNTRFNTNYQVNLLGGKEFKVGKKKKNIFGINGKFILSGGNRFTPIDFEASKEEGYSVRIDERSFEEQHPAYMRFDLGLSYKINSKKMTHTILLDVQNVTNRQNIFGDYYDADNNEVKYWYQTGLFPNFNYRIEF